MPYPTTSQSAPAQRVPAWKRLGLKLKGSASDDNPALPAASASQAAVSARPPYQPSFSHTNSNTPSKRKEPPASALSSSAAKRHKTVSFAEGGATKPDAAGTATPKKAKKAKKPRKKKEANPANKDPTNLERELEYLQQWKTARDLWKFNKNYQSLLIKYVFVGGSNNGGIPTTHIDIFYDYIRSLQGAVRTRLRAEAKDMCKMDDEADNGSNSAGAGAAAEAAAGVTTGAPAEAAEAAKKAATTPKKTKTEAEVAAEAEYARMVAGFRDQASSGAVNANGKRVRRISEVDYVLRFADPALQKRVLRRIRAENISSELSDEVGEANSGASSAAAGAAPTATTAAAAQSGSTSDATSSSSAAASSGDADKHVKLNGGSRKKAARSRKQRTVADDSSDDSDSDSDSESEAAEDEKKSNEQDGNNSDSDSGSSSGSSSSSDEESNDEEMPMAPAEANGVQTSSTSSSSSSSSSSSASPVSGP